MKRLMLRLPWRCIRLRITTQPLSCWPAPAIFSSCTTGRYRILVETAFLLFLSHTHHFKLTHTHKHTAFTLSLSLSLSHTHTHTLSLSLSLSLSHTHTLTHTHHLHSSLTLTHTHAQDTRFCWSCYRIKFQSIISVSSTTRNHFIVFQSFSNDFCGIILHT